MWLTDCNLKSERGRGQNPHQHSTFSFLCFNIFAGFFVCLKISYTTTKLHRNYYITENYSMPKVSESLLDNAPNHLDGCVIQKRKIIQCQKLRILQWLAIVFPIKSREKDKGVSPNDWNRYELWKEKEKINIISRTFN